MSPKADANLVADLRHMTAAWGAKPLRVLLGTVPRLPLYPALKPVVLFRMSSWCWHHGLRPIALWLKARAIRSSGAEIHPAADIGPGFGLMHSVGIVVGHEVVAGKDLVLYQGVTIGYGRRGDGQPIWPTGRRATQNRSGCTDRSRCEGSRSDFDRRWSSDCRELLDTCGRATGYECARRLAGLKYASDTPREPIAGWIPS